MNHKPLNRIKLPCPLCSELDAPILIDLWWLHHESRQFTCWACKSDFGRDEIDDRLAGDKARRWKPVLAWLEQVPQPAPVAPADDQTKLCPSCLAAGRHQGEPCYWCQGTGRMRRI